MKKHLTQTQSLIANQQSWAFKSREPAIGIFKAEEKRIKGLYGSRRGLKYKIKLNDQILDPNAPGPTDSPSLKGGKVKLGKTIQPTKLMQVNIKKM